MTDEAIDKKRFARDDAYVARLNDALGREIRRAFGEFLDQCRLRLEAESLREALDEEVKAAAAHVGAALKGKESPPA